MARQKKQYKPIVGQKWWEKILDRITREESEIFSIILLILYASLLLIPASMISNTTNRPDAAETFMHFWFRGFVPISVLAMINPCSAGWGFRMEKKLLQPIKDYIARHGPCTYDELVTRFMPVKIHLGIDDALERLVSSRELVYRNDLYCLPTQEDRKRWFDEWFEDYGKEYTFGLLEDIFALDPDRVGGSIDLQFYTRSGSNFEVYKEKDESSGQMLYQVTLTPETTLTFETFQALAEAAVFNGQTLRECWCERIVLTYLNDEDIDWWIEQYLH